MVMGLRHSLIERQSSQVDVHRTGRLPGIHPQNPRTGTIFTTLVKIRNSPAFSTGWRANQQVSMGNGRSSMRD